MILVFDIGNTQIKMGVFDGDILVASCRMTTGTKQTSDEYGVEVASMLRRNGIELKSIEKCIISSVVPRMNYSFIHGIQHYIGIEPVLVDSSLDLNFKIAVQNPKEVGADILTDTEAAYGLYGGPLVIVDFGTATKFVVVNGKGELIAVVISPGVGICADALVEKTAQLPSVALVKPKSILTDNTIECIQAGLVFGNIGQVEYIVKKIKEELAEKKVKVVATGGYGSLIAAETDCVDVYDSTLTLKGLRMLAESN